MDRQPEEPRDPNLHLIGYGSGSGFPAGQRRHVHTEIRCEFGKSAIREMPKIPNLILYR